VILALRQACPEQSRRAQGEQTITLTQRQSSAMLMSCLSFETDTMLTQDRLFPLSKRLRHVHHLAQSTG